MKRYWAMLLFVFLCGSGRAQYFEWSQRAGRWAFDLGYGVGSDNAGNVYIAGKYEMDGYFGGTYVGCAGNHDMYLAKYSAGGTFRWVRTAGGTGGDYAWAIAVDGAGNSYVTGEIESTAHFGSSAITSNGDNDIFIAKYDTNGNLLWLKKLGGGTKSDKGLGICISGSNIYITGKFEGQGNFAGTTMTSSGGREIFIAKYTTSGIFQWVKKAGGSSDDEGLAISSDAGGNIYVTGYFKGTANFGGISLSSYGGKDIFIAKYNASGNVLWVKKAGGSGDDAGNAIKVDGSGRVFVTGSFRNNSSFGGISLSGNSGGRADIFTARYDGNGNAIWVKKAGGSDPDAGRAIAADASGNTFITGNCGRSATFGTTTVNGPDSLEIFFASYDVSGNFRWVLKAGGQADASDPDRFIEMGLSICTDPSGNVFASGAYRSASSFGGTTLQPWSTHTEVFLTKIRQNRTADAEAVMNGIQPAGTVSFCSGGSVKLSAVSGNADDFQWYLDETPVQGAVTSSYRASAAGSYTVRIVKEQDTMVYGPTLLVESQTIDAQIQPVSKVFCKDSDQVLMATKGENYLYQWKKDGNIIPGATGDTYRPEASGNYQVKIMQGNCIDWSPVTAIGYVDCSPGDTTAKPGSLNLKYDDNDSVTVKLYPNPNKGVFNIEINMPASSAAINVEVVSSLGQVVFRKTISSATGYIAEHIELDGSVPTGIYFLVLDTGGAVEKTRMMLCR